MHLEERRDLDAISEEDEFRGGDSRLTRLVEGYGKSNWYGEFLGEVLESLRIRPRT